MLIYLVFIYLNIYIAAFTNRGCFVCVLFWLRSVEICSKIARNILNEMKLLNIKVTEDGQAETNACTNKQLSTPKSNSLEHADYMEKKATHPRLFKMETTLIYVVITINEAPINWYSPRITCCGFVSSD